jgi:leader peptidase (prepilin peptidase) / N-methyltransferase
MDGAVATTLASLVLFALLAGAAAIDLRTRLIPNWLNAGIAAAGLAATLVLQRDLLAALIGAAAGYGAIVLVNAGYRTWRGRDGIGLGDAKLLGAGGCWVGWIGLPFALLAASVLGLIVVAVLSISGRRIDSVYEVPFGPFLAAGLFAAWIGITSF